MSLMNALGLMIGKSKNYCPDCSMEMKPNGCCDECGYGEEDDMEEEDEKMETQDLLDLKNDLQRVMDKIDRLIVNNAD